MIAFEDYFMINDFNPVSHGVPEKTSIGILNRQVKDRIKYH